MAMLPKKKLEWREGQNLYEFLHWMALRDFHSNFNYVGAILNTISDEDFSRLYNEFLAEGNEAKC